VGDSMTTLPGSERVVLWLAVILDDILKPEPMQPTHMRKQSCRQPDRWRALGVGGHFAFPYAIEDTSITFWRRSGLQTTILVKKPVSN